jgi:hypothetical protein
MGVEVRQLGVEVAAARKYIAAFGGGISICPLLPIF